MTEVVSENDINAYVDGELDPARLVVVEDYLARNPLVAARVMADLHARDGLRLALRTLARPTPRLTIDAAGRLEAGFFWQQMFRKFRKVASIGFFVGLGWLAHDESGLLKISGSEAASSPPAVLEEALHAHRTELFRLRMYDGQVRSPEHEEAFATIGIRLPSMPPAWEVIDVQAISVPGGASINLDVKAGSHGRLSLFIARVDDPAAIRPAAAREGEATTYYWQKGSLLFALTGDRGERSLRRAAQGLYDMHR